MVVYVFDISGTHDFADVGFRAGVRVPVAEGKHHSGMHAPPGPRKGLMSPNPGLRLLRFHKWTQVTGVLHAAQGDWFYPRAQVITDVPEPGAQATDVPQVDSGDWRSHRRPRRD